MSKRKSLSTRERLRLFNLHNGICHICNQKIDGVRDEWEIEHIIPHAIAFDQSETDENRKPAHKKCHAAKTKDDVATISKCKRVQARHIGAKSPSKSPLPFGKEHYLKSKISGGVTLRNQDRKAKKPSLPPRPLYEEKRP